MKEFSEACERNKEAIYSVIEPLLAGKNSLLEIGSGTGQHAVYFANRLPKLAWQTSDRSESHHSIKAWIKESTLNNVSMPLLLDVLEDDWPAAQYESVFSANTAHIMPWRAVEAMFQGVSQVLSNDGIFILYGPFNYDGKFTSESNRQFEGWLKSVDSERGIRDFEEIEKLANRVGMNLSQDAEMPANNRLLVWSKKS